MFSPGPPPGSLYNSPRVYAELSFPYEKPGILTHISLGMESIPAVLLTGSIVSSIIVSVQSGQFSLLSPPRSPTISTVTRLAPSHAGGNFICGALKLGVAVLATGVSPGLLATGMGLLVEQVGRGMPGKEVTCQQETKLVRKIHKATVKTSPTPININWNKDGRLKARSFCTKSNFS